MHFAIRSQSDAHESSIFAHLRCTTLSPKLNPYPYHRWLQPSSLFKIFITWPNLSMVGMWARATVSCAHSSHGLMPRTALSGERKERESVDLKLTISTSSLTICNFATDWVMLVALYHLLVANLISPSLSFHCLTTSYFVLRRVVQQAYFIPRHHQQVYKISRCIPVLNFLDAICILTCVQSTSPLCEGQSHCIGYAACLQI